MGKRPLGIGLIGVGRHGLRYARHILHDLPAVSLKAVCRRSSAQGLDLPGAESVTVYGQARALIEDPAVEAIIVVTPPIFTRDICKLAVQVRKPLLIEKPLAASAADAEVMVSEARQAGVPLMTAQTLRFDSTIQEMQKRGHLIGHSERLRLTSHIEMKATDPGHAEGYGKRGALLEIGVHMLDLVRFLTGEEVQDIRCTMDRLPPTAPDTIVSAQLMTVGGTVCLLDIARVPEGRVGSAEWIGLQGRLQADWISRRLRWISSTDSQEWEIPPSQTVLATLMAFLDAVEQRRPMPITGEDGLRAVEIAEACYRSAEAGGALVALHEPTE
ncbi:MAG: Gfo/Idh/MocA family oxidoreductase [Nitrospira sp.]|nr:Gfo/Idh/MocA family oxidoreductase [Nitrospira sp.]MBH0186033.1 Gfo/Idh/MocA family oxidoreductase [Nitrospira sp.]